ncbi:hypothetical protein ACFLRY_01485 [Bacteroidota bacterium]
MTSDKTYNIQEVKDKRSIRKFLDCPASLYKDDPYWSRPLDKDIESVFDRKKNKKFRKGDAIRWILSDNTGKVIGRVAAFFDEKTARKNDQPTGGMGFFDCINDKEAAFQLFDVCKSWLKEKGMEAMDGPINFGDREMFWGCLSEGFKEPIYNMPYNHGYYNDLFEAYGFKNYFNQYTFHRKIEKDGLSPQTIEKAKRIFSNPDYTFSLIDKKNLDKFAEDFTIIFNKCWATFPGVPKLAKAHAMAMINQMKPIIDPRLMITAYYKNEPSGFFIMIPDISQISRKFNGKLNWYNKLRLLYFLKFTKSINRIIGVIFGVIPEHQKKGLDGGMVVTFEELALKKGFPYTDLEMNWIADFNPTMMKMVEQIGGKIYKVHITYRYLFDRNKEFKRAKRVN